MEIHTLCTFSHAQAQITTSCRILLHYVKYETINLCLCAVDAVNHIFYLDDAHRMKTSRFLQIRLKPLPLTWCRLPLQNLVTSTMASAYNDQ